MGATESGFIAVRQEGNTIIWEPTDREGTITFPAEWFPHDKVNFSGVQTTLADVRLSYAMKLLPYKVNPTLPKRRKDEQDIQVLENIQLEQAKEDTDFEPTRVLDQVNASPSVFGVG